MFKFFHKFMDFMNFACFMDASMLSIFSWFWSIFGSYGFAHFMDASMLWMNAWIYGCIALWIYGCIYGCIALWFWSIFMMLWHSYKQLHWRNARCLCMGSSAYWQLFKVNMQQLIRRWVHLEVPFLVSIRLWRFPSPVEVYRHDGIVV